MIRMNQKIIFCFKTDCRCLAPRNVHMSETNASNISHYYIWYDLCVLENFPLWLAAVGRTGPPRKQRSYLSR
jgi:hypothetical protein